MTLGMVMQIFFKYIKLVTVFAVTILLGGWTQSVAADALGPAAVIEAAGKDCTTKAATASKMCIADSSPAMKTVLPIMGMMTPMLKQMDQAGKGADEICEQGITVYDAIEKALLAYGATCATAKAICHTTCTKSSATVKEELAKAATPPTVDVTKAADIANEQIKAGQAQCASYEKELQMSIPAALNHIISNKQKASACKKQVQATACEQDPTALECIDCTKAENAGHTKCICLMNPRAPGCAGFSKQNVTERDTLSIGPLDEGDQPAPFVNPVGADSESKFGAPSDGVAVGGGSASGGGGGGGGFGGSPSGGQGDKASSVKTKGLSANIIGSEGGGGGRGGSAGGQFLSDSNNPYAKYLPKANDNEREPANLKNQITGAFGPSNFEKVSQRYKAIRWSTLDQSK